MQTQKRRTTKISLVYTPKTIWKSRTRARSLCEFGENHVEAESTRFLNVLLTQTLAICSCGHRSTS